MGVNLYLEKVLFFYVIKNPKYVEQYQPEFFSDPDVREIFGLVKEFEQTYKSEPSCEQINELARMKGKSEILTPEKIYTFWQDKGGISNYTKEWLEEQSLAFGKWKMFYNDLVQTIGYVRSVEQTITNENCDAIISKASNIFTHGLMFDDGAQDAPRDFFDLSNHKIDALHTRTSGYKFIDLCLDGGFFNKSLIVLMGGPKSGKSLWLGNIAANSVLNGYHTIYISLEMGYQLVNQRIGSNIFNIPISEYKTTLNDVTAFKKQVANTVGARLSPIGKLFVQELPTSSKTAKDIEAIILKKEKELSVDGKPFKFDNVIIDYLNIMKDLKNPNSENTYQKIKSICEDVRAMAQRNDWCVVSVTQTNRNGMNSSDLEMTDVSESSGLIATVDALFGIIRSNVMRADNVYFLKALALRNSPHMGDKMKYNFQPNYLRITEDTESDIVPDGMDIPKAYTSATINAVEKIDKSKLGAPVYSEPMPAPKLGITEQQITGADLFK